MRGGGIFFATILLTVAFVSSSASAAKRVALVFGNDAYATLPNLNNAATDARGVADKLETLGFDVIVETDAGRRKMGRAIAHFQTELTDADVGLAFFAGHGIQSGGRNYLIPTDSRIEAEEDLPYEGITSKHILDAMGRSGVPVSILILDACRDNPLPRRTRSAARGLTVVPVSDDATGTAILYSAAPGQTAQDGEPGKHGVFTGALLQTLSMPGLKLEDVFKRTAALVARRTHEAQKPWFHSSLTADVYLGGSGTETASLPETVFWRSIEDSDNPAAFEEFLEQFPRGQFAGLASIRLDELRKRSNTVFPQNPEREKVQKFDPSSISRYLKDLSIPPTERASRDQIREAQRLLAAIGEEPGPADGLMGPKTRTAIENFQRLNSFSEDGNVTEILLKELRTAKESQTASYTSPPLPTPESFGVKPAVGVFPSKLKAGDTFKDCDTCPEMVVVPPGSFKLGSNVSDAEGRPAHWSDIPNAFAVGRYEVTQAEWRALMGANPSSFRGDRNPVETITWKEAKKFLQKLSSTSGHHYRLLSNSEWEYVARGGKNTKFWWGDKLDTSKARIDANGGPVPVGSYPANAFGLHDMLGNVWEWTEDCDKSFSRGGSTIDSLKNTEDGCFRIRRGGSWGTYILELARSIHDALGRC